MRRFWTILIALLVSLALILSAGCKREHLKKDTEEGAPGGGPPGPATPGLK